MNFKKKVWIVVAVLVLSIVASLLFMRVKHLEHLEELEELEEFRTISLSGMLAEPVMESLETLERLEGLVEEFERSEKWLKELEGSQKWPKELKEMEKWPERWLEESGASLYPGGAIFYNEELLNEEYLLIGRFINELPSAFAAYNRFTELWYQKEETLLFIVDLSFTNSLSLPTALKGEPANFELPVTPHISVELTGSAGLDIEPKGRIKKSISDAAPTIWNWKVNPTDTGVQFLMLTTYIHISKNEESEPYGTEVYTDLIMINARPWDHLTIAILAIQPIWVFAGVVITALVGAYGWLRRKVWRADRKPYVSKIRGIRRGNRNRSE